MPDEQEIVRLQESLAFADRRIDELDEAMRELGKRLGSALARIERLEQRLADKPGDDPEIGGHDIIDQVPPHAARAPYDRPTRDDA